MDLVTSVFLCFQSPECEEKKIRARRDDQADQTEWTQWDAKEWAVKVVNCGAKMSYVSYVRMRVTDFNCCTAERQSSLCRKSDHQSVTAGIKWSEKARARERESESESESAWVRKSQCVSHDSLNVFRLNLPSCVPVVSLICKGQNAIHGARSGWGHGFCFDLSLRQDIRHSWKNRKGFQATEKFWSGLFYRVLPCSTSFCLMYFNV